MRAGLMPILIALVLGGCDSPIRDAERAVRATLKDPESARFSDVESCGTSDIVQGYVNAKNSYGGYDGKRAFVFRDGRASVEDGDGTFATDEMACAAATAGNATGTPAGPARP